QLSAGVEPQGGGTLLVEQLCAAFHHKVHRGVPVGLDQLSVTAYERSREPVGRVVGLPTVEVLGVQASTVDPVLRPTAYPDDPVVLDRDVQCVTVGVQERRGPYPSVHILRTHPLGEMLVDPHGPL